MLDLIAYRFAKIMQSTANDCSNKLSTFASGIEQLITIYSTKIDKNSENQSFCMGGLQQFLIRNKLKDTLKPKNSINNKDIDYEEINFNDIPVPIQLYIFSLLDPKTLCRISVVCTHWKELTEDEILWRDLLLKDIETWQTIQSCTHPDLFNNETINPHNEDEVELRNENIVPKKILSTKEIYLHCSPELNVLINQQNASIRKFSEIVRSLLPKKTPKIAMFGPGLESSTSGIVRHLLNRGSMFETLAMFPGQFEGVGSGFTLKMINQSSTCTFHLSTLYSTTRFEREKSNSGDRLKNSKLFDSSEKAKGVYEVQRPVRELCRTMHAFIFVVDATKGNEEIIKTASLELNAMLHELWTLPDFPLLILSCIPSVLVERIPCIQVARLLKLQKLRKPWMVQNCDTFTLEGVADGLLWLVERAIRI